MSKRFFILLLCCFSVNSFCFAQPVEIDNYSVNNFGQVQLSIQGQEGKYYILHAQHGDDFNWATSLAIGVDGTMIISESSSAYTLDRYTITEHDIDNPDDYDQDGIMILQSLITCQLMLHLIKLMQLILKMEPLQYLILKYSINLLL
jgi:hypothetical protein